MRSILLSTLLTLLSFPVLAQMQDNTAQRGPVSRREVRRWLTVTQEDAVLSAQANQDLIAEIKRRGVNFALSEEEEWAFSLLEASDELLVAIREAIPADQREALLLSSRQKRLYTIFMAGYNQNDLNSRRAALDAGKEYVAQFGKDPALRQNVTFITRMLPQLERTVRMMQRAPVVTRRN